MHTGHKQATAKFIASWIIPKLKQESDHHPSVIIIGFKTEFGVDIEYSKALRGKERALEMIHGTFEDAYKAMPQYCADIEAINPGSIVSLELTSDNRFKRVFISFVPVQWVLLIVVLSSVSTVPISKRNTKAFFLPPLQLML